MGESAISREDVLFRPIRVERLHFYPMPLNHRVYRPGQLPFMTTSTYRRTRLGN